MEESSLKCKTCYGRGEVANMGCGGIMNYCKKCNGSGFIEKEVEKIAKKRKKKDE